MLMTKLPTWTSGPTPNASDSAPRRSSRSAVLTQRARVAAAQAASARVVLLPPALVAHDLERQDQVGGDADERGAGADDVGGARSAVSLACHRQHHLGDGDSAVGGAPSPGPDACTRGIGREPLIEPAQAHLGVDGGQGGRAAFDDLALICVGATGHQLHHAEHERDSTETRHDTIVGTFPAQARHSGLSFFLTRRRFRSWRACASASRSRFSRR